MFSETLTSDELPRKFEIGETQATNVSIVPEIIHCSSVKGPLMLSFNVNCSDTWCDKIGFRVLDFNYTTNNPLFSIDRLIPFSHYTATVSFKRSTNSQTLRYGEKIKFHTSPTGNIIPTYFINRYSTEMR